ncbi:MAG: LysM domain-containing protein [Chloroflexota bacterium]
MKFLASVILALSLLASLALPVSAQTCSTQHTVKLGENLFRIGLKYGVSWPDIAKANNLADGNKIKGGQVLCIPAKTTPPVTSPSPTVVPTFTITGVVRDQTIAIQTSNFPANQKFDVLMGPIGTHGVNGTKVTTTDSGAGGSFSATYNIPANLRGATQIAIRLQSASGYFAYNWFHNNTTIK